jgi:myo-inositol 2-dehydrogenase / D-chiro-inositol 1-dehydrogenase
MKRREFFTASALGGAALTLGVTPLAGSLTGCSGENVTNKSSAADLGMFSFSEKAPDGQPLRGALIGCGGRGSGAATQFLLAGSNLSIIALADVLQDRLDDCRQILKEKNNNEVPEANCFLGFDGYKKALAMPDVDVVLICTPAYFHPYICKEAVEAGKHVFVEKPAGVDPVGVRTLIAAGKMADAAGLTIITGNQRRHSRDYWEAYLQMKGGLIGDVIAVEAHFNTGPGWVAKRKPEWSDMEYNIRNQSNIKWLCGDHVLDIGMHNIDVVSWFSGMNPMTAEGFGGCARRQMGDIFDFFCGTYVFENGKSMLATTRQMAGCEINVGERILGTKGIVYLNDQKDIRIEDYEGKILWAYDYEKSPMKNPYEQEHIHLVESIRQNKKINQALDLANSTMVAIMGREAAYTGKLLKWDEMMSSDLRYGPDETDISKLVMGPTPFYSEGDVPRPGKDANI